MGKPGVTTGNVKGLRPRLWILDMTWLARLCRGHLRYRSFKHSFIHCQCGLPWPHSDEMGRNRSEAGEVLSTCSTRRSWLRGVSSWQTKTIKHQSLIGNDSDETSLGYCWNYLRLRQYPWESECSGLPQFAVLSVRPKLRPLPTALLRTLTESHHCYCPCCLGRPYDPRYRPRMSLVTIS